MDFSEALTSKGPIVIAEIGTNHNQDIEEAKFLIQAAAEAGCQFVKFQIYEPCEIVNPLLEATEYGWDNAFGVATAWEAFDRFLKTPKSWFPRLADFTRDHGIGWGVTVHGDNGIQWATDAGPDFVKIASMDHSNLPLIESVGKTFSVPVLISLGMADYEDVLRIGDLLPHFHGQVVLLHCSSLYPPRVDELRMSNIPSLRDLLGVRVGYSDHTVGVETAAEAASLGARVFEKHVTRHTEQVGPDHEFAIPVSELGAYVHRLNEIEVVKDSISSREFLGLSPREEAVRSRFLKSIHVTHDLRAGQRISKASLYCARPGVGIPPRFLPGLIGKTLSRSIPAHTPIQWSDLAE